MPWICLSNPDPSKRMGPHSAWQTRSVGFPASPIPRVRREFRYVPTGRTTDAPTPARRLRGSRKCRRGLSASASNPLFDALLKDARERGVAISTLFPTAPRIYRRFGYEVVGQFDTVELATADLAAVRATGDLRTRRALPADFDAVRDVYDAWAAAQNGPLTRRGPSFPATAEEMVASFTGVTLAVDGEDRVHGYASWRRGPGYGEHAALRVADLVATREGARAALLRTLGSFASVAPVTRFDTSGDDPVRYLLPSSGWHAVESEPYMLRLLDPGAAFGLRTWPAGLDARRGLRAGRRVPHRPRRPLAAHRPRRHRHLRAHRRRAGARGSPAAGWRCRTPARRAARTCGWRACCPATTATTGSGTPRSAAVRCTSATTSEPAATPGAAAGTGSSRGSPAPVSSMISRSTPMPIPPAGGMPYSIALQEVLVELHRLGVAAGGQQRLLHEPLALDHRVVELGVRRRQLDAVDDQVPGLDSARASSGAAWPAA